MSYFANAIMAGALLVCSGRAFAQSDGFGATMKKAAEKQSGQHYFQAFDLYVTASKQASNPDEKKTISAALVAWLAEQRRFYNYNTHTVDLVKKNLAIFEGVALFEADGLIARAYENTGDLPQAWEWHNKRLAISGIPEDKIAQVRTQMQELKRTTDRCVEAVKRYEPIIANPASSKNKKDEARMRLVLAMSEDPSKRNDYYKAAAEFLADEAVASDWKLGVFEGLKNVYMQDQDWDNAALCFRKYADFPGLAPGNKARILFMLGDVNWRQRHQLQEAVHVFREIVAIPNVPANAKQNAETWLVMLTEQF